MNTVRSLYVHIPFCARKCPYCSFAVAVNQDRYAAEYVTALMAERVPPGNEMCSVYVGGGTPSSLGPDLFAGLFDGLRGRFRWADGAEVSTELNPEHATPQLAAVLRRSGVSRVSLGAQSFSPAALGYLGRAHAPDDTRRAVGLLREAGIGDISLDLLFGWPGQEVNDVERDLEAAARLGVDHVSLYTLTVEPRSLFHVRGVRVDAAAQAELYVRSAAVAAAAGYSRYEVSNFARPGHASRHHIHTWEGGEYIGLGMGAHSHIDGVRCWNADTLSVYLDGVRRQGSARAGEERLEPAEKLVECLLVGLRMDRGVDLEALERRFGETLADARRETLEGFIALGLLIEEGPRLRATDRGILLLDEMAARLV